MQREFNIKQYLQQQQKDSKIIYQEILDPNLGLRPAMEDYIICLPDILNDQKFGFFCVLDGHGGSLVSSFVQKNYPKILKQKLLTYKNAMSIEKILKMSIENIENQLRLIGARDCGTTFCGILLNYQKQQFYTINLGDSRILEVSMNKGNINCEFITEEHKLTNKFEEQRVQNSGGLVINNRLGGNLMISRALGDFDMKKYGLSSEPEIKNQYIQQNKILIISSDGIWDVFDEQSTKEYIQSYQENWNSFAENFVKKTIQKGSKDNISCIILRI